MLDLIDTFEELEENAIEFAKLNGNVNSKTLKTLSQFNHWYYFPSFEIFAPSKFIGHKNTSIETYSADNRNGDQTQKRIKKLDLFYQIEHKSQEFDDNLKKLSFQLSQFNKNVSDKTIDGSGGIYILKPEKLKEEELKMINLQKSIEDDLLSS